MPCTKKFPKDAPTQGYPNDGDETLNNDIAKLRRCYDDGVDDVQELVVGKACANLYATAKQKLQVARAQLLKQLPAESRPDEVHLDMVALKRNRRIMQKAVAYAACNDKGEWDTPQLQMVRDVLRATLSFPSSYFEIPDIGSAIIDAVDRAFGRKLAFVKNRFVESRYPNLIDFDGRTLRDELKRDIVALANDNLSGRDTFYRDLQLLIRLDADSFPNGTEMRSVLFEVQIVSNALHMAKLKKDNGPSGHDMYKVIREVMEYAEYVYYKEERKGRFKLADVERFYPDLSPKHWQSFTGFLRDMWDSYSHRLYEKNLQNAIDNSAWFERNSPK